VRPLVVGTNVVVSGIVGSDTRRPPQRLLDAMLRCDVRFALSLELLTEWRAILERPKSLRLHGLNGTQIADVLTTLVLNAEMHSPPRCKFNPTDPCDQMLMDLVVFLPDSVLITGDKALLQCVQAAGCQAWTPRQWLEAEEP